MGDGGPRLWWDRSVVGASNHVFVWKDTSKPLLCKFPFCQIGRVAKGNEAFDFVRQLSISAPSA